MNEGTKKKHESYGMIDVSRFTGNGSQFFGSDLVHNGGISITISNAEFVHKLNSDWHHSTNELIRIRLSHNQFVDAITSGMNTSGVPCTIDHINGKRVSQVDHAGEKKDQFRNDMSDTNEGYRKRIDEILGMLDGKIGIKKAHEIKHELEVLRNHISSNTNFVMECFNESMEKTVTEAKHSISNYIDHKVHSLGIEKMKEDLQIQIENE